MKAPEAERIVKILVLGATGMLGNAAFRVFSRASGTQVFGTVRRIEAMQLFPPELASRIVVAKNLEDPEQMERLFDTMEPQVVVNCTALGKPLPPDPMELISMFSLLPHRLAHECRLRGVRLVQISSDGVFSGSRGGYTEEDLPDAGDVYGIAKLLGEVSEPHAITLRTSIIGHELQTKTGLLEWFLSQRDRCRCYTRAIFSGFPAVVLAQVIRDVVLPRPEMHGVYHVATRPISKFDLLRVVAQVYGKSIEIVPDDAIKIDRSLNARRFERATGYVAPDWPSLVSQMWSCR